MDFDFITDNMAVGTWPQNAADVQELAIAGITHVLNVREFDDIPEVKGGFTYCWNPTPDWTPEAALGKEPKPLEWFAKSLDFFPAIPRRTITRKLYCHCSAGVNRSATTVWMFLRAMQIKVEDCSWILDHNRPWAALGEVFDRTWRKDAEKALMQMGYIQGSSSITPWPHGLLTITGSQRPENWGQQNNKLLKEILTIVERLDPDIKTLGGKISPPQKQ